MINNSNDFYCHAGQTRLFKLTFSDSKMLESVINFTDHHVSADMLDRNDNGWVLWERELTYQCQPSLFPKYLGAYGVVEPLGQRGKKTRVLLSFRSLRAIDLPRVGGVHLFLHSALKGLEISREGYSTYILLCSRRSPLAPQRLRLWPISIL